MGLQIQVFNASTSREIDAAFATFVRERPDALFVGGDAFSPAGGCNLSIWQRAMRFPRLFRRGLCRSRRADDLRSEITAAYRQAGTYAGRILKGAKPVDLPVLQSTKFELVINVQTARLIGLTVPPKLLAIADEVIE